MMGLKSVFSLGPLRLSGLIAALFAAALIVPIGNVLRTPIFDLWQRLAPRDLSDTKVRVVMIDSDSIAKLGSWPWPRSYLAQLTDGIARRGARAIAFDMLFAEPDRLGPPQVARLYPELGAGALESLRAQPSQDDQFALAIGAAPVILARAGVVESAGAALPEAADGLPAKLPASFRAYPKVVTAIPELDMVAAGHGLINAEPDSDGLYRQLPLLARAGGRTAAGLALETARIARGGEPIGLKAGTVAMGKVEIPVTGRGEMRLRLGRFPADKQISALDIFGTQAGPDLRGTAVLVGLAAEGTVDVAATPLEAAQYGVLIQAQALDALLRGEGWLSRPRWAWVSEWGAALVVLILCLWLLPRRQRGQWLVPLAMAATVAASWFAYRLANLLLDPIPPLTAGAAASIAIVLGSLQQARRERARLRDTLVEERVTAAAADAELEAARSIQRAMLPTPALLAGLDPRAEVAAVLEPARSVGGDFYDLMRLPTGEIAFAVADVTGKGVPAALFMALSKALAKSVLLRGSLAGFAATLQQELSRDAPEEMGLTMLVGTMDLATGETRMINAGHENPFVMRADGRVEEVVMEGGPPFCITDYPWPVEPILLARGDTLVLVTDGVTEAQDAQGRLFGRDRLAQAIRTGQAGDLAGAIVAAVRAFEGDEPASDDLTVMTLRYRG